VIAQIRGIRVAWVAHLEAEHAVADEVDPLDDLLERLVRGEVAARGEVVEVRGVHAESIRIDDASERVALLVVTVGIELASSI